MTKKDQPSETFKLKMVLPDGSLVGRRCHEHKEEAVCLRPLSSGPPTEEGQELVRLSYEKEGKLGELGLVSVGTVKGPAKFTSRSYRNNYDSIFGTRLNQGVS